MKNKIKIFMLAVFIVIIGYSCAQLDSLAEKEQSDNTNLSDDSQLSALTTSSGSIENFFGATYSYNLDVESNIDTITVLPVASDSGATIKVNNVSVDSGSSSNSISLETGENIINVLVTAEDGTKQNYSLVINRLNSVVVESLALSADWHEGILIAGEEMWFSIDAVSGVEYTISWDGKYDSMVEPDNTADIVVTATDDLTNGTDFFTEIWVPSESIIPDYTGLVYIKVNGRTGYASGTFGIKVE